MQKIIYLNGPSSSGKTTIAKALQNSITEPYLLLGMDKLIDCMPEKINNWTGGHSHLGFSWKRTVGPSDKTEHHIHTGPYAEKLVRSLKDIVILLASQDYNLIIDDVALGAIEVEEWRQMLKNYKVLYVGILSPLDILESRELARKDRMIGTARAQYCKVHENVAYDLEIDTYAQSLQENVDKIKNAVQN